MEDLSPSRATGVELLAPNDRNKSEDTRPRPPLKLKHAPSNLSESLLDADADKEEKHQLDELA
jgi:hypothetical protein